MSKKTSSMLVMIVCVVVAALAIYFAGGWMWNWLLAMHGIRH